MRTKPARSDEERIRAFHQKLDQPSIVEIDDATAYWLEGEDGRQIGEQSPTSEAPLLAALAEICGGVDPIELSLVCNAPDEGAPDDDRYVISTGIGLLWMAESAAGASAAAAWACRWGTIGPQRRSLARAPSHEEGSLGANSVARLRFEASPGSVKPARVGELAAPCCPGASAPRVRLG